MDYLDGNRRCSIERARDQAGVHGDLAEGRLAVHLLAAGDEPDLELAQRLHIDAPESRTRLARNALTVAPVLRPTYGRLVRSPGKILIWKN
jgi:hypothetical protein